MNSEDDSYVRTAQQPSVHVSDADAGDKDEPIQEQQETEPAQHGQPRPRSISREIIETVLITVLIFLLVRAVIQNFKVEGDSMAPTLHSEQYLLVNKGIYWRYDANFLNRLFDPTVPADMRFLFGGPQRGDILVFQAPDEDRDFIKRVIAVPGETVEVKADRDSVGRPGADCGECGVYVNGVKLEEPYINTTANYSVEPTIVQPGYIYVLGDNRRNSSDSHVWGPLSVDRVVGLAFVSYWPQDRWGFFSNPTYAETEKR